MEEPEKPTPVERPIRALRRRMLERLLEEFGGPQRLSEVTQTPKSHLVTARKSRAQGGRDIGDELATKLETATDKPHGWMDREVSDEALAVALMLDRIEDPRIRGRAVAEALSLAVRASREVSETPSAAPAAPVPTNRHRARE